MNKIHFRALSYLLVATVLSVSYYFLRTSSWQGSAALHTLMEIVATMLAFMVGGMALVRYYSKQDDIFLIIGTGFLGAGFLDGYHTLMTSIWFKDYLPYDLQTLIPWSWVASRMYLAMVLYYSWWNWHKAQKADQISNLNPWFIYSWTAVLTLASFLFFVFFPLPSAYFPDIPFHRPEELVPAFFFALALIGFLRKGAWRENSFEHWLVLALIVNLVSQAVFVSFSGQLFDVEFDAAHLLKTLSYLCVLIGLYINMYESFKQLEVEIDERNTTQIALEKSEIRYSTVIDSVLEGIITINDQGLVASMNPAAEKTFGYKEEEIIGKNVKILMPEPYQSEHDGYLQNYKTTGVAKIIGVGREVKGRRKNGSVFSMELGVSEMQVDGERMFSGVVRDITERNNYEMALSNNKERLRAVINAVLEGIITINERGLVATMNPAAENIFCYDKLEVIGQNIKMLMPEPYQSEHDGYISNYLTTGITKIIGKVREVQGLRRNGEIFPMELSVSEIQIDNKRMFIGLVRDISERKKIDKMKNEFISTVSHELRTPLTSIQGSLELILSGTMDNMLEDCKSLLEIANNNSTRLVRLINDILDIEKIESGKMESTVKPIEIMSVVQQTLEANQAYADEYGVKLVKTSQINCYVMADSDRLIQVLTNLISNATKFSPKDEVVEVGVAMVKNNVRVSVTDYGSGIPDEFRERIFKKFSQADASSTKQQGGTGLGLSICKAIVEKLGGQINYASEMNKKTCFYFDLPVYRQQMASVNLETENQADNSILICEDDPDVANLLKLMLEKKGYSTDIAFSAEQAKQKLFTKHYAAMTLDLMLPGQSGIDFYKELRQTEGLSDIPVIVISAIADKAKTELNGDALSICDWLDKPIDHNRLESAISQVLADKTNSLFQVLHIEDDPDIVSLVKTLLQNKATVDVATDLKTAKLKLEQDYDLVILDLILPDGSGSCLLPNLAHRIPPIPVIVFSVKENTEELLDYVSARFVKSKTSNEDLVQSIEWMLNHKAKPQKE